MPYEKVGKNEPVCIAGEVPFEIPESWEWVRLKNLTIKEIKRGKSPKYADNGNVYVFAQKCNVKLGGIDIQLAKFLDMSTFAKYSVEEYMVNEDIIINSTGNGTLGRIGMFHDTDRINDSVIVPDSHVTIIRASDQLKKDYLFYALKYYQPYLEKMGEGSTNQTELRPSTVAELFVPVPPIEEQERIVAKLLEVLPMVDVYGEKEKSLQAYNTDFPAQLKKSILQEAVKGKLVPQDPSDEPASVLLERIRTEKERLIKAGKIKRDKHKSVIFRRDNSHYEKRGSEEVCIDDEIPFDIPGNWCWSKMGVCLDVRDGTHDTPKYVAEGVPLITSKNLCNEEIDFSTAKLISKEDHIAISLRSKVDDGDIMYAMIGSIGNPVLYNGTAEFSIKNMALFKKIANGLDMEYVYWFLYLSQDIMKKFASGGVQSFVSLGYLRNYWIPVPPIEEQRRIVAVIKQLLPKIHTL